MLHFTYIACLATKFSILIWKVIFLSSGSLVSVLKMEATKIFLHQENIFTSHTVADVEYLSKNEQRSSFLSKVLRFPKEDYHASPVWTSGKSSTLGNKKWLPAYIANLCVLYGSQKTAINLLSNFKLRVFISRGGFCLLGCTNWILKCNKGFSLSEIIYSKLY